MQGIFALALALAAVLLLVPGVFLSMGDAEALLQRLSIEGALPGGLVELHHRLGTPVRLIDTTAAGTVFVVVLAGGRVEWLARAFAVTIAAYLLIKIAALVRLRGTHADAPYRVPLHLRPRDAHRWGSSPPASCLPGRRWPRSPRGDAAGGGRGHAARRHRAAAC